MTADDPVERMAQELREWAEKLTTYPHQPPLGCKCPVCEDADTLYEAGRVLCVLRDERDKMRADIAGLRKGVPYREFCAHPAKCAGHSSCQKEFCCAD